MGYDVWAEGDFIINEDRLEEARPVILRAIAEKQGFKNIKELVEAEEPTDDPGGDELPGFISNWALERFEVDWDENNNLSFSPPDDSFRHEEWDQWLFEVIAPFCNPSSRIEFQGEDQAKWAWAIERGQFAEHSGETVFGPDIKAPDVIEKIVSIIYPDGKLDTDYGGDMLGALHLIENALREGGFGPQAGMTELERLADV